MSCKHELQHLVGTSDGILCKNCGRKFVNFTELEDSRKCENLGANPETNVTVDKDIEKSKTKAVPTEVTAGKGAKGQRKKAVSKPESKGE